MFENLFYEWVKFVNNVFIIFLNQKLEEHNALILTVITFELCNLQNYFNKNYAFLKAYILFFNSFLTSFPLLSHRIGNFSCSLFYFLNSFLLFLFKTLVSPRDYLNLDCTWVRAMISTSLSALILNHFINTRLKTLYVSETLLPIHIHCFLLFSFSVFSMRPVEVCYSHYFSVFLLLFLFAVFFLEGLCILFFIYSYSNSLLSNILFSLCALVLFPPYVLPFSHLLLASYT